MSGTKHDGGKLPWHLLPFDAIEQIVRVLDFGAKKYAERNWEKGIAHSRTYAATLRHLTSWWQCEDDDPETGLSHLAHAACEVLFALAFVVREQPGVDDRPRPPPRVLLIAEDRDDA
jgi:dATP/dGTP diphosphohydrolase